MNPKVILCPSCDRHIRMEPDAELMSCPFCSEALSIRREFNNKTKQVVIVVMAISIGVVIALELLGDRELEEKFSPAYGVVIEHNVKFD